MPRTEQATDTNANNWRRLCEWMEPMPKSAPDHTLSRGESTSGGWWRVAFLDAGVNAWIPCPQTRDVCALIEKCIEEVGLWGAYEEALDAAWLADETNTFEATFMIRLTPAQRCAAMAAVIGASRA